MLKAVIFDFDGTLANTEKFQMKKWNVSLRTFGIKISKAEYCKNYCGKSSTTTIPELLKKKYPQVTYSVKELAELASEELQRQFSVNKISLMPKSHKIIEFLKKRDIKYAVCSAKDQKELLAKLNNSGTTGWFDERLRVTQSEVNKKGKPDPDMYLYALKQLGVSKEEVLVFEDTDAGVLGASRAGLKVIALPTKYTKNHDFSKANYVVKKGWPQFLKNYKQILNAVDMSL